MQLRSSGLFLHRDQWIIDTLSKAMSAALVRKSSREMTPPKSAAKMTAKSMPQKSIEIPLFSSVEQWMTVCPRKPLSSKTILAPVMICKLFYSTNQIRTTMSRILFWFDKWFNDVQAHWYCFLSRESFNVYTNHNHRIYQMFSSVFRVRPFQVKQHPQTNCFGSCYFFAGFKPSQRPRARSARWHIPISAEAADYFQFQVLKYRVGNSYPRGQDAQCTRLELNQMIRQRLRIIRF